MLPYHVEELKIIFTCVGFDWCWLGGLIAFKGTQREPKEHRRIQRDANDLRERAADKSVNF